MRRSAIIALFAGLLVLVFVSIVGGQSPKPRGRLGVRDLWWRDNYSRGIYGDDAILDATVAVHGLRPIDVRAFGAYPDDSVADCDSVQVAVNYASSTGGGVVNFCEGQFDWAVGDSLVLPSNVILRGAGWGATIIAAGTGHTGSMIVNSSTLYWWGIEDLQLKMASTSSRAVSFRSATRGTMRKVRIIANSSRGTAFHIVSDSDVGAASCYYNLLEQVYVVGTSGAELSRGFYIGERVQGTTSGANENTLLKCSVWEADTCVSVVSANATAILNCNFESYTHVGVKLPGYWNWAAVTYCRFESATGVAIYVTPYDGSNHAAHVLGPGNYIGGGTAALTESTDRSVLMDHYGGNWRIRNLKFRSGGGIQDTLVVTGKTTILGNLTSTGTDSMRYLAFDGVRWPTDRGMASALYMRNYPITMGTPSELGAMISQGSGSPEGVVLRNVGSLHIRTDGATCDPDSILYLKTSGTGNTGWSMIAPSGDGWDFDFGTISADTLTADHVASTTADIDTLTITSLTATGITATNFATMGATIAALDAAEATITLMATDSIAGLKANLGETQVEKLSLGGSEGLDPKPGQIIYELGETQVWDGAQWRGLSKDRIDVISTTGSISPIMHIIIARNLTGEITRYLPSASQAGLGKRFLLVKDDPDLTDYVIIQPYGTETINGKDRDTLYNRYDQIEVVSTGNDWIRLRSVYQAGAFIPPQNDVTPPIPSLAWSNQTAVFDTSNSANVKIRYWDATLSESGLARFQFRVGSGGTWLPGGNTPPFSPTTIPAWKGVYSDTSSYHTAIYDTIGSLMTTAQLHGQTIYGRMQGKDAVQNVSAWDDPVSLAFERQDQGEVPDTPLAGANGATITLTGSGLGTAAPVWLYDNFDQHTTGALMGAWTPAAQCTSISYHSGLWPTVGPRWRAWSAYPYSTPSPSTPGAWPVVNDSVPRYAGSKHTRHRTWRDGSDASLMMVYDGEWPTDREDNTKKHDEWYISTWIRYRPAGRSVLNAVENWKPIIVRDFWNLQGPVGDYDCPTAGYPEVRFEVGLRFDSATCGGRFAGAFNNCYGATTSENDAGIGLSWVNPLRDRFLDGEWVRIDLWFTGETNSPYGNDAMHRLYVNGKLTHTWGPSNAVNDICDEGYAGPPQRKPDDVYYHLFKFGEYQRTTLSTVCSNLDGNGIVDADVNYDDMFIQTGGVGHIEMGNASTWANCSHLEIQRHTSWTSTEIQFVAHKGALTGAVSYVYLVMPSGQLFSTNGIGFTWQ